MQVGAGPSLWETVTEKPPSRELTICWLLRVQPVNLMKILPEETGEKASSSWHLLPASLSDLFHSPKPRAVQLGTQTVRAWSTCSPHLLPTSKSLHMSLFPLRCQFSTHLVSSYLNPSCAFEVPCKPLALDEVFPETSDLQPTLF